MLVIGISNKIIEHCVTKCIDLKIPQILEIQHSHSNINILHSNSLNVTKTCFYFSYRDGLTNILCGIPMTTMELTKSGFQPCRSGDRTSS